MNCIFSSFEPPETPFWHPWGFPQLSAHMSFRLNSWEVHSTFLYKWDGWDFMKSVRAPFYSFRVSLGFHLSATYSFLVPEFGWRFGYITHEGQGWWMWEAPSTAKPVEVFTQNSSGWEGRTRMLLAERWSQHLWVGEAGRGSSSWGKVKSKWKVGHGIRI